MNVKSVQSSSVSLQTDHLIRTSARTPQRPVVTERWQDSRQELTKERGFSVWTLDAEVDDPGLKKERRERWPSRDPPPRPNLLLESESPGCSDMTQGPSESVQEFAARINKLGTQIFQSGNSAQNTAVRNANDQLLQSRFISGLRNDIRRFVLSRDPLNLEESINAALIEEQNMKLNQIASEERSGLSSAQTENPVLSALADRLQEINLRVGRLQEASAVTARKSGLDSKIRSRLFQLLISHKSAFARSTVELSAAATEHHRISLQHDYPIKCPIYKIPFNLRNEFRRQIADLEKAGIISKSNSQYNTPALFVRQKEKWRLVLDFRKLNERTVTQDFVIPTLDDILHEISGSNYFSALDMKSAFNQIPLHFADRHKTAFSTPDGDKYQFNRLCFGLKNSPKAFQSIAQEVLGDLLHHGALVYIDDIILFTKTIDEHFELLVADHLSRYVNNITIALPDSKDINMQREDSVLSTIIQKIDQNDVSPQISNYFINGEGLLCHLSKRPSRDHPGLTPLESRVMGIQKRHISSYSAHVNGRVEKPNQSLANILASISQNTNDWDEQLPHTMLALNSAIHEATYTSPFFLEHGRDIRLSYTYEKNSDTPQNKYEYVEKLLPSLEHTFNTVLNNLKDQEASHVELSTRATKEHHYDYKIGSLCFIKTPNIKSNLSPKLRPKFEGPYRVIERFSNVNYRVQHVEQLRKRFNTHVNRMIPFIKRFSYLHLKNLGDLQPDETEVKGIVPGPRYNLRARAGNSAR
ncbi:retrovirus-related Pol polyprotein from transposon 17.6 [Trichonephila clavipes]|nr:retrovirus-related Pol polyprotein from transposon 17.6 [Trichonephila clavipes]